MRHLLPANHIEPPGANWCPAPRRLSAPLLQLCRILEQCRRPRTFIQCRRAQLPPCPGALPKFRSDGMSATQQTMAVAQAPDPELVRIRDLVYQVAGIFHPDNKLRLLLDRCGRRMKELQVTSLREYFECLTVKPTRQGELIALLNEITIGETCFFRNQPQLDALRQILVPKIIEAKARLPLRHLRIWSAGCSTGEEPYTLSMLLMEESFGRLKDWVVEIIATDLNERSLAHARNAVYGTYSTRNLTTYYRQKYFLPVADQLQVQPAVRGTISFSRVNLSDEARMTFIKSLDLIFCCNVLIYFDIASKRRVIQHFYNNLLPHGYLFMGHSESLYGVSDDFHLVHLPGATAYVKAEPKSVGR
jgi:chemotaxis protein methyltransferase CheR